MKGYRQRSLNLASDGMEFSKQIVLVAFLSSSLICAALAQQQRGRVDVPIVIGGDKGFDACAGTGEVIGLDSKGAGFLPVQSGPDRPYREIDRLFNGNKVYICDQRGLWYAVIYSESRELTRECGVGRPWQTRQAYTGPCRYGWAPVRYIRTTSGIVR
jgi:hypothetical protein